MEQIKIYDVLESLNMDAKIVIHYCKTHETLYEGLVANVPFKLEQDYFYTDLMFDKVLIMYVERKEK